MATTAQAFQAPTGTRDVLAPESRRWEALVGVFAAMAERAGYGLVISPLFEDVRVFVRGMGEGTDVVSKEMYELEDKGGRHLALRPEGTASVVRAFVEHRPGLVWKAWYATPAFRYERPQAGRLRQHHQLGVEALGSDDADLDTEVIALAGGLYDTLGLSRVELRLGSMGDASCLPAYVEALVAFLDGVADQLCAEHGPRYQANPLRVLDCKREECRNATFDAPHLVDRLCLDCAAHFSRVCDGLDRLGVRYVVDHRLVRGFDYYTRTTFEFVGLALESAQNGVGGGGRYNGLVEALGGPPTPGIGFGIGIERLLLACDAEGVFGVAAPSLAAYVVDLTGGQAARDLTHELRAAGLGADRAFDHRSLKAQLKAADRSGAAVAVIVGPDEVAAGTVTLRRLRAVGAGGHQEQVPRGALVERVGQLTQGASP
ncbi:MAG: histidine--tRNA ligase [Acidimicrobiales bacterium]|nr:MAG: histidine--tRNA ligase [Acidimicrobiales bacterium]